MRARHYIAGQDRYLVVGCRFGISERQSVRIVALKFLGPGLLPINLYILKVRPAGEQKATKFCAGTFSSTIHQAHNFTNARHLTLFKVHAAPHNVCSRN